MKNYQKKPFFVLAYFAIIICSYSSMFSQPLGTLDNVQGSVVYGWGYDSKASSQSNQVRFYVDGTISNGVFAGSCFTDFMRQDVNDAKGITGIHGFRWFIPTQFRDGKIHSLNAYGVGVLDTTNRILLSLSPKTFQVSPFPSIASRQPYNIGAWYFTAWSPLSFLIANTQRAYGRRDAWGGVRDYAQGYDPYGLHVDFSSRKPLLGFYDLTDQAIMDQHINQAASRGLSFFAFYWYWNTDYNQEDSISIPLKKFLTSSQKNKLKFLIAPIRIGKKPMTLSMWNNYVVPFIVHNYLNDSSYLTTVDGRPVVVLFDIGLSTNSDIASAVSTLRDSVAKVIGKNPLVLYLYQEGNWSLGLEGFTNNYKVDGFASFHLMPSHPAEPYDSTFQRWPAFTDAAKGFYSFTSLSTGNDGRPWYLIGYANMGINDRPYHTNISLGSFASQLWTAKQYLDLHPIETSKTVIIHAWNEWGEGGIIEPSVVYGYQYLDSIKSIFGLTAGPNQLVTLQTNLKVISFGNVPMGKHKDTVLTLLNKGTDTLRINSMSFTNLPFNSQGVIGTVPPGQSRVDTIRFTPTSLGPVSDRLIIFSNSPTSPDTIYISGFGVTYGMAMSSKRMNVGIVRVGQLKDSTITITNTGNDTLAISTITSSNTSFMVRPSSLKISAGSSGKDTVRFTPSKPGADSVKIIMNSNATSSPDTVIISGFGGTYVITLSAKNIVFGTVRVGLKKDTLVTLTNTGNQPILVSNGMSNSQSFITTPTQFTIPASSSIFDTIRFAPTAAGQVTAKIVYLSNAISSPDTISVLANGSLTGVMEDAVLPTVYSLNQNYPNPFNPSTTIRYALPHRSQVSIKVFNMLGQVVADPVNTEQPAGYQSIIWNAANVASGMYFYRIEVFDVINRNNQFVDTKKMILLK